MVRKWFVLSVLTSRYSGSPESQLDYDIRNITEIGAKEFIDNVISAELSETYWEVRLPQQMNTSAMSTPTFNVFLSAQVKNNDKGFLSKDITVGNLITLKGDVHHIFPKEYLKKYGYNRWVYNQIANYVMTQSEINIAIGSKPPSKYLKEIMDQCQNGSLKYSGIDTEEELLKNLKMNCIPEEIFIMDANNYYDFLDKRRKLMSQKIRDYFFGL